MNLGFFARVRSTSGVAPGSVPYPGSQFSTVVNSIINANAAKNVNGKIRYANFIDNLNAVKPMAQAPCFTYRGKDDDLRGRRLLLALWAYLLEEVDTSQYADRTLLFDMIIHLMRRDEFDLSGTRYDASTGKPVSASENKVAMQFRCILTKTLTYALKKLSMHGVYASLLDFCRQVVAFCYFCVPRVAVDVHTKVWSTEEEASARSAPALTDMYDEMNKGMEATVKLENELRAHKAPLCIKNMVGRRSFLERVPTESKDLVDGLAALKAVNADWTDRYAKLGKAYMQFLCEVVKEAERIASRHREKVVWSLVPGYYQLLQPVLIEMYLSDGPPYAASVNEAANTLLKNALLLPQFIRVVFSKTNSFDSLGVSDTMDCLAEWFSTLEPRELPPNFDFDFFFEGFEIIIHSEHYLVTSKALLFIYHNLDYFSPSRRRVLVLTILLKNNFFRLFLHWSPFVRSAFHRLLLYKMTRLEVAHSAGLPPSHTSLSFSPEELARSYRKTQRQKRKRSRQLKRTSSNNSSCCSLCNSPIAESTDSSLDDGSSDSGFSSTEVSPRCARAAEGTTAGTSASAPRRRRSTSRTRSENKSTNNKPPRGTSDPSLISSYSEASVLSTATSGLKVSGGKRSGRNKPPRVVSTHHRKSSGRSGDGDRSGGGDITSKDACPLGPRVMSDPTLSSSVVDECEEEAGACGDGAGVDGRQDHDGERTREMDRASLRISRSEDDTESQATVKTFWSDLKDLRLSNPRRSSKKKTSCVVDDANADEKRNGRKSMEGDSSGGHGREVEGNSEETPATLSPRSPRSTTSKVRSKFQAAMHRTKSPTLKPQDDAATTPSITTTAAVAAAASTTVTSQPRGHHRRHTTCADTKPIPLSDDTAPAVEAPHLFSRIAGFFGGATSPPTSLSSSDSGPSNRHAIAPNTNTRKFLSTSVGGVPSSHEQLPPAAIYRSRSVEAKPQAASTQPPREEVVDGSLSDGVLESVQCMSLDDLNLQLAMDVEIRRTVRYFLGMLVCDDLPKDDGHQSSAETCPSDTTSRSVSPGRECAGGSPPLSPSSLCVNCRRVGTASTPNGHDDNANTTGTSAAVEDDEPSLRNSTGRSRRKLRDSSGGGKELRESGSKKIGNSDSGAKRRHGDSSDGSKNELTGSVGGCASGENGKATSPKKRGSREGDKTRRHSAIGKRERHPALVAGYRRHLHVYITDSLEYYDASRIEYNEWSNRYIEKRSRGIDHSYPPITVDMPKIMSDRVLGNADKMSRRSPSQPKRHSFGGKYTRSPTSSPPLSPPMETGRLRRGTV